jgi:hypothetical protein
MTCDLLVAAVIFESLVIIYLVISHARNNYKAIMQIRETMDIFQLQGALSTTTAKEPNTRWPVAAPSVGGGYCQTCGKLWKPQYDTNGNLPREMVCMCKGGPNDR